MTYSGFKGYRPVVATLKETGLAIAYEFKEGNDNGGRVDILKKAFRKMPSDKKIGHVLLVGRNPKTGEEVKVKAMHLVKFRPSKALKAAVKYRVSN